MTHPSRALTRDLGDKEAPDHVRGGYPQKPKEATHG